MLYKKIFLLIVSSILSSVSYGSEQSKKDSLFEAIEAFEQEKFTQSANIFRSYAGKTVPVAEPYCLDLARQGYLASFSLSESIDDHPEKNKANLWFGASKQLKSLREKKAVQLNTLSQQAEKEGNGPLLYLIGTVFENGTEKVKVKRGIAQQLFQLAFQKGDPRGIFGLNRVLSVSEKEKLYFGDGIKFSVIYNPLSLIKTAYPNESGLFRKISAFLHDKNSSLSDYFLYKAAQFGEPECQFSWAQSHCENENQSLYWMMQAAGHNHLEAIEVTGHFFEQGKGTPKNWDLAYKYLQRAAHHSNATALDYQNFGLIHEQGKGIPVNYDEASLWYEKAYQANSSDSQTVYDYGRALSLAGKNQEAFVYLKKSKDFNDEARYNYGLCLYHLNKEKGTSEEAVEIFKKLALKGNHLGVLVLAKLIDKRETNFDLALLTRLLENIVTGSEFSKDNKVDALVSLYNLYDHIKENLIDSKLSLIEKALDLEPLRDETRRLYAQELKNSGRYEEALKYYQKLEKKGVYSVNNDIGSCYDLISQHSSEPEKIKFFAQQALEYYLKQLKDVSHPDTSVAAYNIYALKLQGRLNEKAGDEELLKYLQMAAEGGDEDALCDLGSAYLMGIYGLETNIDKAESCYRHALSKGHTIAKLNLIFLNIFEKTEENNTQEINQLFSELLIEDISLLKYFSQVINKIIKHILNETEESQTEALSTAMLEDQILKTKENEQQNIIFKPSRKEKEKLEEEQRLKKKFERLTLKLEDIKDKKQTKFRKIKTLVNQHIQTFTGQLVNAKGSGRRIKIGNQYSGFHQPHTSDIRGGALESLKKLMDNTNL